MSNGFELRGKLFRDTLFSNYDNTICRIAAYIYIPNTNTPTSVRIYGVVCV